MYLPGVASERTAARATDVPQIERARTLVGSVLIVDDDRAVRDVVTRVLDAAGLATDAVESGAEAIAHMAADPTRYDLAIVDMTMPGLSGVETVQGLRELEPSLPVILSSGYSLDSIDDANLQDIEFLHKPYRLDELLERVAERIGEHDAAHDEVTGRLALATG